MSPAQKYVRRQLLQGIQHDNHPLQQGELSYKDHQMIQRIFKSHRTHRRRNGCAKKHHQCTRSLSRIRTKYTDHQREISSLLSPSPIQDHSTHRHQVYVNKSNTKTKYVSSKRRIIPLLLYPRNNNRNRLRLQQTLPVQLWYLCEGTRLSSPKK